MGSAEDFFYLTNITKPEILCLNLEKASNTPDFWFMKGLREGNPFFFFLYLSTESIFLLILSCCFWDFFFNESEIFMQPNALTLKWCSDILVQIVLSPPCQSYSFHQAAVSNYCTPWLKQHSYHTVRAAWGPQWTLRQSHSDARPCSPQTPVMLLSFPASSAPSCLYWRHISLSSLRCGFVSPPFTSGCLYLHLELTQIIWDARWTSPS